MILEYNHRNIHRGAFWAIVIAVLLSTPLAFSQDAMFVDSSGNVGVGTNTPSAPFHVVRSDGTAGVRIDENSGIDSPRVLYRMTNNGPPVLRFVNINASAASSWTYTITDAGTFRVNSAGSGAPIEMDLFEDGNMTIGGTLTEGSSRSIKEQITPVDPVSVLRKLELLTISEWSYRGNSGERHVGPMAENFYRTFGLGPDDKHIAPKDLAGIALTAAQALSAEVRKKDKEIRKLEARLSRLEAMLGSSK